MPSCPAKQGGGVRGNICERGGKSISKRKKEKGERKEESPPIKFAEGRRQEQPDGIAAKEGKERDLPVLSRGGEKKGKRRNVLPFYLRLAKKVRIPRVRRRISPTNGERGRGRISYTSLRTERGGNRRVHNANGSTRVKGKRRARSFDFSPF